MAPTIHFEMETDKSNTHSSLHVVMFPFFAFGHISPFVQLSNKLSSHGVKVSFFSASANVNRIRSMLNDASTTQIIPFNIPHVEGLPPGVDSTADLNPTQSELLKVALDLMQPQIRTLLSQLKPHFVLFDFAQEWLPKLASELGIQTVFYSVFIALSTAYVTVPSRLPEPGRYPTIDEMKKPPPGFPQTSVTSLRTFEAQDSLYIFKSFHGKPCVYDRVISGLQSCSVILAKTCDEMEAPYINYAKSQFKKPVLLVGPLPPEPRPDQLEEEWAKWLDKFEANSVIYCSFGSETFLTDSQIKELALGLELTGLPFFLVLNFPNVDVSTELNRALPEGFLESVEAKGIIHTGWVQQQQILAHKSVGCYLCHAGFSSVIEAIVNDCQLVMLPQKGDQYVNSKLVHGDLKAGVEVNRIDEDGFFGKEDIKRAVETVMLNINEEPGKSIRNNQRKWKEFLLNKDIQNNFIKNVVKEMEAIAGISSI
ncbi:anthocyanidin 3-O-glucosyltransferase-like [Olea europaea var. sylvestris]|uniref:anthocyanidin 3-O-glucosyltransferase-like n=1 Tax=Olea europaea var. sylvestris TaxID=158386 RepID=UPI000C1D4DE3|nr:anthocyanidin 3-O-glucosyltransferase-like [Olea europaea var. sylvestris]